MQLLESRDSDSVDTRRTACVLISFMVPIVGSEALEKGMRLKTRFSLI